MLCRLSLCCIVSCRVISCVVLLHRVVVSKFIAVLLYTSAYSSVSACRGILATPSVGSLGFAFFSQVDLPYGFTNNSRSYRGKSKASFSTRGGSHGLLQPPVLKRKSIRLGDLFDVPSHESQYRPTMSHTRAPCR